LTDVACISLQTRAVWKGTAKLRIESEGYTHVASFLTMRIQRPNPIFGHSSCFCRWRKHQGIQQFKREENRIHVSPRRLNCRIPKKKKNVEKICTQKSKRVLLRTFLCAFLYQFSAFDYCSGARLGTLSMRAGGHFSIFIINFTEDGLHKRLYSLYKVLPNTKHTHIYTLTGTQTKTKKIDNKYKNDKLQNKIQNIVNYRKETP